MRPSVLECKNLYVHIPFCYKKKCRYCDFFSLPVNKEDEFCFLEALDKEVNIAASSLFPQTIYIGGGTPTALSELGLSYLFSILERIPKIDILEFTVEANPNSLTFEKAEFLKSNGVNRLSIGAQSFFAENLDFLGRAHSPRHIVNAVRNARAAGFENISLDLISDVPETSLQDWMADLRKAVELNIEHISCYSLTIEPGTPLARSLHNSEFEPVSDDESAQRMLATNEFLSENGFERYETSNYSRPGKFSRHNMAYWRNSPYLGLGPSATSYDGKTRKKNISDLAQYCEALYHGQLPVSFAETLNDRQFIGETAMLMLRRRKGIEAAEFLELTGVDPFTHFFEIINRLGATGHLEVTVTSFRIPDKYFPIADSIASEFVEI